MVSTQSLADALREQMQRAPYPLTPGLLARLSGIPKSTIINWLDGRVTRPRRWEDLLRVAEALRLDEPATSMLLLAAGHPPLAELRDGNSASTLLRPWPAQPAAAAPRRPNGLPAPVTPLVGRARELALLRELLLRPDVRLVTLTGTGGSGKTRLALQAAADARPRFADVSFVPLAALTDHRMVLVTIAHGLGLQIVDAQLLAQIAAALAGQPQLLVLDNFEHLRGAAPDLAALLAAAPDITVLVTSRARLHVDGEHVFEVPPLPAPRRDAPPEALAANPAIELFVQRARAVDPGFALSRANARIVAEICVKLDGLPLSIELAAARVRLLTPEGLLARMGSRLNVLRWGSHSLLQRHRTLRDTLDWSYALLDSRAQLLFRCLAVFMGGGAVEAIRAVCDTTGEAEALDLLMVLADSSLVQTDSSADEPRYVMLETLREYAAEKLAASGAYEAVRRRHAAYFMDLSERAEPRLSGAEQVAWLRRLDGELGNLRAALGGALERGDGETAGRIAASLRGFWLSRGYLEEGLRWAALALGQEQPLTTATRAKLLVASGRLARQQGSLARAADEIDAGLELYRALGDTAGVAGALGALGVVAYDNGQFAQARAYHRESMELRRALGDDWGVAAALLNLGEVTRHERDLTGSLALLRESLMRFQALDNAQGVAMAGANVALVLLDLGDVDAAHALLAESLVVWRRLGEQVDIAECLGGLAGVAAQLGDVRRAARLSGAVAALRERTGASLSPVDQERFARYTALIEASEQSSAAYEAGRAMTLDQAIIYALDEDEGE